MSHSRTPHPYFDVDGMNPAEGFVAWIDMMGAGSIMKRSLKMSMNFIGRIHTAILDCHGNSTFNQCIDLYPVMDGVYIFVDKNKTMKYNGSEINAEEIMKHFIKCVYRKLFNYFSKSKPENRFLIRASVAYGKVYQGKDIQPSNNNTLGNSSYKNSLLIGMPMIQAYETEKLAPPFGIYIHESARYAGNFPYNWFKWFNKKNSHKIYKSMKSYFNWCANRPHIIDYPSEKIKEHKELALEYFKQDVRIYYKPNKQNKT